MTLMTLQAAAWDEATKPKALPEGLYNKLADNQQLLQKILQLGQLELENTLTAFKNPNELEQVLRALVNRGFIITEDRKEELDKFKQNLADVFEIGLNTGTTPPPAASSIVQTTMVDSVMQLVTNLDTDLKKNIGKILSDGYAEKKFPRDIVKQMSDEIGISQSRAKKIATTETMRGSNAASWTQNHSEGMKYFIVDVRAAACKDCIKHFSGRVFKISETRYIPPIHPFCYHKDTEVFTSNGWKLFRDVEENDLILSMNPQTNETEFIPFVRKIGYHYKGEMYHLTHRWFDMSVTPDHDVFTNKRVDRGKKGRKLEPFFVKPSELNSEHRIPRTCENNRESPEFVDINGLKLKSSDFAYFMAWWLSEGHIVTTRPPVIGISQKGDEIHKIKDRIQKMLGKKVNVYIDGRMVEFRHKGLYDYLKQFGKSHEKYIPKELFKFSRDDINLFLDIYVKGDGHERLCSNNLVENSSEKVIYTSSPKMADGLSYLILLAGFYPSFHITRTEGKEVLFKNGTYILNQDMTTISLNKSKTASISNMDIVKVPYDDMVYCLELPKWHTLWIKSNNKTAWGGNCACVPLFFATKAEAQDYAKKIQRRNELERDLLEKQGIKLPKDGTGPNATGKEQAKIIKQVNKESLKGDVTSNPPNHKSSSISTAAKTPTQIETNLGTFNPGVYKLVSTSKNVKTISGVKIGGGVRLKEGTFTRFNYYDGQDNVAILFKKGLPKKFQNPEDILNVYKQMSPTLKGKVDRIIATTGSGRGLGYHVDHRLVKDDIYIAPRAIGNDPDQLAHTILHESAHAYDYSFIPYRSQGKLIKPERPFRWMNSMNADKKLGKDAYVTGYARNGINEDFAESVALYHADPKQFKIDFPSRYETLRKVM